MAWLRDGRKLIGVLRSWDQFGTSFTSICSSISSSVLPGNLVLQDTTERMFVHSNKTYADIKRGIYLVRGENLSVLGEIVSHNKARGLTSMLTFLTGFGQGRLHSGTLRRSSCRGSF